MGVTSEPALSNPDQLFPGQSEMARRMRAFDWQRSPLGPPQGWPQPLRLALGICLTSRFPMQVWWGSSLTLFYNDASISLIGPARHPGMLGRPGAEAWGQAWDTVGPLIASVFAAGQPIWSERIQMFVSRSLAQEEVYVSCSFSPVFGDDRRVDGVYCTCAEMTDTIVGSRRLETLRQLGVEAMIASNVTDPCGAATAVLGENPCDLPFGAIYRFDEARGVAACAGRFGSTGMTALPESVDMAEADRTIWPLAQVLRSHRPVELTGIADAMDIRSTPWPEPIDRAMILPLRSGPRNRLSGLLVAGVSPRQPMTDAYRTFFELVAQHAAMAIAGPRRLERRTDVDGLRERHCVLQQQVRERTEEVHVLRRRIANAQDDERKRIARDIHDQIGQQLTAVRLSLEALDAGDRSDPASEATERVQRLCEELDHSIDFLVWSLRPAVLDHLDLAAALDDLSRGWSKRFGIRVDYQPTAVHDLQLPPEIETNVYRIAQEALHNVHKHARASRVAVFFERHGDRAALTIKDNGRGFKPAGASIRQTDGLGLVSIRERAALVGGEVEIESSPGRGTTVFLQFPI